MKKILLIFLSFLFSSAFCNDGLSWDDLTREEEGVVTEVGGNTISGIIKIKPCAEKIVISNKDSIIKINVVGIKDIQKGNHHISMLFFNDSVDFFFGEPIDTIHTLKFYKGYNCNISASGGGWNGAMATGMTINTKFSESYIVSLDGKDGMDFKRTVNGISFLEIDNYKRKLQKTFSDNPRIISYLDTFKKVHFDDIPKVVEFINSIY
mgnify:FL=1